VIYQVDKVRGNKIPKSIYTNTKEAAARLAATSVSVFYGLSQPLPLLSATANDALVRLPLSDLDGVLTTTYKIGGRKLKAIVDTGIIQLQCLRNELVQSEELSEKTDITQWFLQDLHFSLFQKYVVFGVV